LFWDALEYFIRVEKAFISLAQRKFWLGFAYASRLAEEMGRQGLHKPTTRLRTTPSTHFTARIHRIGKL